LNRVALVTGATRGIGLGIAKHLAEAGYNLALCGVRASQYVQEVIDELRGLGIDTSYYSADVADSDQRQTMMSAIRKEFGSLHLLVNNAGVAPRERKDILDASEESFEWVLRVNLQGPYFLTQSVANWMIQQKSESPDHRGTIVNISSISATVASTNRGEYCISKAGISMATQLWAVRLAEYDIPVYEVRPGLIRTDMTAKVTEKYDRLIEQGLLLEPRWGTPDDVGKVVRTLAEGGLSYGTGQVIMVDGGMTIGRL
jgi:NAD(P)-dependent dehydrogenase (short-subunit alcohol dehydrogenase family)